MLGQGVDWLLSDRVEKGLASLLLLKLLVFDERELALILVLQQHLINLMCLSYVADFTIEDMLDRPSLTLSLLLDCGH